MKAYEAVSDTCLTCRVPAVLRVDGKSFHTFTRGMERPFDRALMTTMQRTMQYLCENIQGCVFGYTQSDEITLVLTDYETIQTDAWFGYRVQKMASVAASMATLAFNRFFQEEYPSRPERFNQAMFDARVFSVPKEDVCNCLIWRQKDATRNSIQSTGYAFLTKSRMHGLSSDQVQELLWSEKQINWNNYPTDCKRGAGCYKVEVMVDDVARRKWIIDRDIPIFTQDRDYVERWL